MTPRRRSFIALTGLCTAAMLLSAPAAAQADEELSNTITDVPGIKIGHYEQLGDGYRTGTTVVLTEEGATAGYSQQGGGPGTKETDLLEPGGLVTVALNPAGSPVNPDTCLPYAEFLEIGTEFNLRPPTPADCPALRGSNVASEAEESPGEPFNTTIAVVATDAPLDQTQAQRMAMIANSGLARAIRPVHNLGDGDTVFAMATTTPAASLSNNALQQIYNAGADALGRAVVHALLESETIGNNVAYCDQYPSACRDRERPDSGGDTAEDADEPATAVLPPDSKPAAGQPASGDGLTLLSAPQPDSLLGGALFTVLAGAATATLLTYRRRAVPG